MHREFLSGLRGFTENAAFVGGALVTWVADPLASGADPGRWWYPASVFGVFFVASALLTLAIITADKTEAARLQADNAERAEKLESLKRDFQALAGQLSNAKLVQPAAGAGAPVTAKPPEVTASPMPSSIAGKQ